MVDVELLLSDNGGVRIYPTESSNVIYVREFTNTRRGAWRHINTSA